MSGTTDSIDFSAFKGTVRFNATAVNFQDFGFYLVQKLRRQETQRDLAGRGTARKGVSFAINNNGTARITRYDTNQWWSGTTWGQAATINDLTLTDLIDDGDHILEVVYLKGWLRVLIDGTQIAEYRFPTDGANTLPVIGGVGAGRFGFLGAATSRSGGTATNNTITLKGVAIEDVEVGDLLSVATSGGATAFTGLTDTPNALGTAGQFLRVNTAGTALEFTDAPTGGGGATNLEDLDDVTLSDPKDGESLVYRNGEWINEEVTGGGATPTDPVIQAVAYFLHGTWSRQALRHRWNI